MNKAPISEIFSSIQGEGIFLGVRQVFIRFSGCNLKKCAFCDERSRKKSFKTTGEVSLAVKTFSKEVRPHSVSLTGGEPLLYPEFIKSLCVRLKKDGFPVYLETNGTLPQNLERVRKYVDFIAMDIKLPSSTGIKGYFAKHKEFLEAASGKKIFVKVVITKKTLFSCFKKAVDLVKRVNAGIPFIIQPASKTIKDISPSKEKILLFQTLALKSLKDVRVIAQMHKRIGVR